MVQMTDGTVLVHYVTEVPGGNLYASGLWMRLTPDAFGNYTDGTWSQLPTMPGTYAPQFHATAVLPDGRLLVEGGEYNGQQGQVETNLGAIYDPVSNSWTNVTPPVPLRISEMRRVSSYRMGRSCWAIAAPARAHSSTPVR